MGNFQEAINSPTPVLVDFFAEWCGPCKSMKPILEDLAGRVGEQARILKVDVDKNPGAAQAYGIRGVPTLIIFQNGQIKWRQSGVVPAGELERVLKSLV